MNSRERVQAALRGDTPDALPVMLHNFWPASHELGLTQREYRGNPRLLAAAHIRAVEKYGYDGIVSDIDTTVLAGALGVPVDYPEDEPARCHAPLLASIDEVSNLAPVRLEDSRYVQFHLEAVRRIVDHFRGEVFVRGNCDQAAFSLATMVRTPAGFLMDLCEEANEPFVFELLEKCNDANLAYLGLMAQTGCHMLSNGDSPAGPDMISPDMYRRFARPYEIAAANKAHALGLPYLIHICGDTTAILEDIVDAGVDAVEVDSKTDVDVAIRATAGKATFVGNIDPAGVLLAGTPEQVRDTTTLLVDRFSGNPRFVLNAGCAIAKLTPEANLRALMEAARGI